MESQHHQEIARKTADELVERLKLQMPVDPLAVAATERRFLRTAGADLGRAYDGKLEYVPSKGLFLLYYNTRYDGILSAGGHHPRTRFSICHELGHFFIDHHHQSLRRGAQPHRSMNEFQSHQQIEREADAFAAALLMPTAHARPMVNESPLSLDRIEEIAAYFGASMVSAAIRSVRLSDFPCAVAGIRRGAIAWMFPSEPLVEAGIYSQRNILPSNVAELWQNMTEGDHGRYAGEGSVEDWFQTYDREDLDEIYVGEEYQPVPVTETLLVLLTLDEADLELEEVEDDED